VTDTFAQLAAEHRLKDPGGIPVASGWQRPRSRTPCG